MYSKGLRDAVARLLVVEPQRRASVQEILTFEARFGIPEHHLTAAPPSPEPTDRPHTCTRAPPRNTHQAVAERRDQLPRAPDAAAASPKGVDIVRTIQVPHRFNDLTKALPPSRYDTPLVGGHAPPRAPKYPDKLHSVMEAPDEAAYRIDKENVSAQQRTKLPAMPGKPGQHAVQQRLEPQQPATHAARRWLNHPGVASPATAPSGPAWILREPWPPLLPVPEGSREAWAGSRARRS